MLNRLQFEKAVLTVRLLVSVGDTGKRLRSKRAVKFANRHRSLDQEPFFYGQRVWFINDGGFLGVICEGDL